MTSSRIPHRTALLGAVLLLTLGLLAVGTPTAQAADRQRDDVRLLQMNLCLSGLAGCYPGTDYPRVVEEAEQTIESTRPDVVTLNEACSGDAAALAAATGYRLTFSTVIYDGAPLPCRNPTGRGVFGNAILTEDAVRRVDDQAYAAQSGREERRYACVTTPRFDACVSHLSTRGSAAATNDAQCAELTEVLRTHTRRRPTIFGGDVNRIPPCAPPGSWVVDDSEATQAPGIQHAYGSRRGFQRGVETVIPLTYTDHDALLVTTRRRP